MSDFHVMDKNRVQERSIIRMVGDIKSLSVDFSSWADDNGAVTSAVWTVPNGGLVIGSEAIANNVVTCTTTTANSGRSMIKLVVSNASYSEAIYIRCMTKEPGECWTGGYWDHGYC